MQGVALKTFDDKDFQLVAEGGELSFEKQVKSTGLDDVHGERLGSIVSTYGSKGINGFAVWKEPNYIFPLMLGTVAIEGILFFKFQQMLLLISANIIFMVTAIFQKEI